MIMRLIQEQDMVFHLFIFSSMILNSIIVCVYILCVCLALFASLFLGILIIVATVKVIIYSTIFSNWLWIVWRKTIYLVC